MKWRVDKTKMSDMATPTSELEPFTHSKIVTIYCMQKCLTDLVKSRSGSVAFSQHGEREKNVVETKCAEERKEQNGKREQNSGVLVNNKE